MSTKNLFTPINCITIDTETAPIVPSDKVDPNNMLVYDIGYIVHDIKGNVIEKRSFVVGDIFFGESQKMQSAYYADKIPKYLEEIQRGERIVLPFRTIMNIIHDDIKKYDVTIINAYNTYFDLTVLNNTARYLNIAKYFFPYDVIFWDTMKMISVLTGKKYDRYCHENGFITSTGRSKKSAEVVYRYISGQNDFIEEHRAYDDVIIELEIYKKCRSKKKKMRRELFNKDINK